MKKYSAIILHLGILLSILMLEDVCLLIGCSVRGGETLRVPLLPCAALVCICYLINEWLSGRELPLNFLLAVNAVFAVLGAAAGWYLIQAAPATLVLRGFQIFFMVFPILCGFYFTWFPSDFKTLPVFLDTLALFFILYLFLDMADILLPAQNFAYTFLAVMGADLICMFLVRTLSSRQYTIGLRGLLPVLSVLAACLLLALACALLVSGQIKSITDLFVLLLKYLFIAVFTFLGAVARLLNRFLEWLILLLPAADAGVLPAEPPIPMPELPAEAEQPAAIVSPTVLAGILAALLCIGAFLLIRRLRGVRVKKRGVSESAGHIRRRGHLFASLTAFLRSLSAQILLHIRILRSRKTPSGLALALERYGAKHGAARHANESVPAYLRRLSCVPGLSDNAAFSGALAELSAILEAEYYSGHPAAMSRELYRQIRTFVG